MFDCLLVGFDMSYCFCFGLFGCLICDCVVAFVLLVCLIDAGCFSGFLVCFILVC